MLIAVIGRHWLVSSDKKDRRRLDNPADFVRIEIATALRRDIRVIPVLVEGAPVPEVDQLPDDLKALVRRNAIEVSHSRFNADFGRRVKAIERVLENADAERKRREKELLEVEQREKDRLKTEQQEKECLEAQQREKERLEVERPRKEKQERLEVERRQREEQEQLEAARLEKERLEVEQRERQRSDAERREKERREAEQIPDACPVPGVFSYKVGGRIGASYEGLGGSDNIAQALVAGPVDQSLKSSLDALADWWDAACVWQRNEIP